MRSLCAHVVLRLLNLVLEPLIFDAQLHAEVHRLPELPLHYLDLDFPLAHRLSQVPVLALHLGQFRAEEGLRLMVLGTHLLNELHVTLHEEEGPFEVVGEVRVAGQGFKEAVIVFIVGCQVMCNRYLSRFNRLL